MLPTFRCVALSICGLAFGADALPSPQQFPLKYTALFGGQVHIGGIAVDSGGNAYITGIAFSALPITPGAFQTDYKPATCTSYIPNGPPQTYICPVAFAGKLNSDGTTLAYLTYLGASNSIGNAIAVDRQGNAWIAGTVYSSDLPVTLGALQTKLQGRQNIFVLKLNSAGAKVLFATYLGGSDFDTPTSLTVDANGNAYVAGNTSSRDFPVSPGAFQTDADQIVPGANTSFVTKFDANGRLVYSTYFHGGNQSGTYASSIATDAGGNAYLAGTNRGGSLPTTPGAFQTNSNGLDAAFIAKFDATGSKLLYCTYLTANSQITGATIALDREGNVYVAGSIFINIPGLPSSFPTTPGAFQTTIPEFPAQGSPFIGFITKLNATGSALIYSTFLGATGNTEVGGLVVDTSGSVVALGQTSAFDFPTTPGALRQCNPITTYGSLAFMLKLAQDGSHLMYSTYLGTDAFSAIGMDNAGEVYIAGNNFGNLPTVPGSFGWNGSGAFAAKLDPVALPAGSVSCVVSAASRRGQAIAPGEIVDIFGNAIGPSQMVSASASSGNIVTLLGDVQVLFNGVLAPLLSVGPDQIRAVVPFEVGPSTITQTGLATVQILYGSMTIQPFIVPIAAFAPAIFTVDGRPSGQALMINEDGTLNSQTNPARQGSTVTIYATGLNNTQPALATGAIALEAAPLAYQSALQIGVSGLIQIVGLPFEEPEITYAGAAPGFVAGLTQINFRAPVSILHGYAGLYLSVFNSFSSPSSVYFYLQ